MKAMSSEPGRRLNENTSLIVISEACLGTWRLSDYMTVLFSLSFVILLHTKPSILYIYAISLYSSRYAEFPQHVMQMIFELQPDKRELLLNIVSDAE